MDPQLLAIMMGGGSGGAMGEMPGGGGGMPGGDPSGSLGGLLNGGGGANNLLATLKGLPSIKPSEVQKVATPHLPAQPAIQSGGLMALLQSLGLGGQELTKGAQLPGTLAPSTLGWR